MKAIVCTKYGSPEGLELKEIDKPVPGDNEVLIRIFATTVTSGDTVLRKLTLPRLIIMWPIARFLFGIKKLRKKILGHEFAGEVETVGKNVKLFKKGDQVFGSTGAKGGAHAEYICLPENGEFTLKPTSLTHQEAAALPVGVLTALSFLKKGNIQRGQKVLINGASSSVGTYAVQLAVNSGAEVTGVCSTTNLDLVKSLGAEKVIDYTQIDFTRNGETYDLIFDAVGKSSASACKKSLTQKGSYLSTRSSQVNIRIEDLIFLKELVEAGKLKAVIDRTYTLDQVPEAHWYVDKGHKKGNVVINVKSSDK